MSQSNDPKGGVVPVEFIADEEGLLGCLVNPKDGEQILVGFVTTRALRADPLLEQEFKNLVLGSVIRAMKLMGLSPQAPVEMKPETKES